MGRMLTTLLAERLAHFEGRYELHLSVGAAPDQIPSFVALCADEGAKAVVIELAQGQSAYQPMLCKYVKGSDIALSEVRRLSALLREHYALLRVKIEAALDNHGIPSSDREAQGLPEDCYFEHHVKVFLPQSFDLDTLRLQVRECQGHLSHNALKRGDDGRQVRFITQRYARVSDANAKAGLDRLLRLLAELGLPLCDMIREYNIYDSEIGLDAGWMER